jgi:hypothetical protein
MARGTSPIRITILIELLMAWGSPKQRFFEKVERLEDGCWQWIGGRKAAGYGQFFVDGKKVIAHRWSYLHFVGSIGDGNEIDHKCRNRSCVNPQHLESVTLLENRRRRNSAKTHCANGHEFTEQNTYWWTDPDGYRTRHCVTCRRTRVRRPRDNRP